MTPQSKNFTWLLIALLVFLVSAPLIEQLRLLGPAVARTITISWLLAVGVWGLRGFGRLYAASLLLAGAGVVLQVLAAGLHNEAYLYAAFAAFLAFLLIAVWCISGTVLVSREISINRLVGSVSVYLLFGVAWAVLYALVEMLAPGSFYGLQPETGHNWSSDWLYFSFVTMTTLGYGDIGPVSPAARTLAYLQAIFGIFYIAILVAGIVGAYISERQASEKP